MTSTHRLNGIANRSAGASAATPLRGRGPFSGAPAPYLQQSILFGGDGLRFEQLFAKLDAGTPVRVMAIGSSVTGAHGGCTHSLSEHCPNHCGGECYTRAQKGHGWARMFVDWLAVKWPVKNVFYNGKRGSHELYNGGKGATHVVSHPCNQSPHSTKLTTEHFPLPVLQGLLCRLPRLVSATASDRPLRL